MPDLLERTIADERYRASDFDGLWRRGAASCRHRTVRSGVPACGRAAAGTRYSRGPWRHAAGRPAVGLHSRDSHWSAQACFLGVPAAWASARLISSSLFGVTPSSTPRVWPCDRGADGHGGRGDAASGVAGQPRRSAARYRQPITITTDQRHEKRRINGETQSARKVLPKRLSLRASAPPC